MMPPAVNLNGARKIVPKHSVHRIGHWKTTVTVEQPLWDEFKRMAAYRDMAIWQLLEPIRAQMHDNLSSAVRMFVVEDLQRRLAMLEVRAGTRLPPKPRQDGLHA
jgi:predicted DNA-binding ribbon-helix-helix protein